MSTPQRTAKASKKMKLINFKVDEKTYRRLRIYSAKHGSSVSSLIRDFLDTILK